MIYDKKTMKKLYINLNTDATPAAMKLKPLAVFLCAVFLFFSLFFSYALPLSAAQLTPDEALEAHRAMEIQTNQIPNWPAGPVVGAESAILIEAETGTILYAKNIHQQEYPASTTKILTSLIVTEQCAMDEMVTFSHDAVFDTPWESSHIAMDVGQALTVEQCLNAILIRSANEVSYAVAEHISGTSDWSVFAETMNRRAQELGCLNSHFVNPNGLPDENHYTTAYDLAMIGRAFFANEMLCKISLTRRLDIPASDTLPNRKLELNNMAIIPGGQYAYEYLLGCKTGYTASARSCLVSCAEKNGMRLICVVMRDESPYQYLDTISLFEYGFHNFAKVNVSQADTKYNMDNVEMFYSGNDIFGSSKPLLALNRDDFIVLPGTASFEDTESIVSYNSEKEEEAARITYFYQGAEIGSVGVSFASPGNSSQQPFSPGDSGDANDPSETKKAAHILYINIVTVLTAIGVVGILLIIALIVKIILRNYSFAPRQARISRWETGKRRRKKNESPSFRDFDF